MGRGILLIDDLIETFTAYLKDQKGYSLHTTRNYHIDLRQFSKFLSSRGKTGDADKRPCSEVKAVDPLVIREYLGSLYGHYKRTTVSRKAASIRSFFVFLEKKGLIQTNPAADIGTPKLEKHVPVYLPVDDVFRLLDRPQPDKPLGLRDLAILELLYSSGLRLSEVNALNISSIDFDERLVRILGKGSKERIVPIAAPAAPPGLIGCGHSRARVLPLRVASRMTPG